MCLLILTNIDLTVDIYSLPTVFFKLQAAINMARLGKHVEVCIVQVGTEHAMQALRGNTPDIGTIISM